MSIRYTCLFATRCHGGVIYGEIYVQFGSFCQGINVSRFNLPSNNSKATPDALVLSSLYFRSRFDSHVFIASTTLRLVHHSSSTSFLIAPSCSTDISDHYRIFSYTGMFVCVCLYISSRLSKNYQSSFKNFMSLPWGRKHSSSHH